MNYRHAYHAGSPADVFKHLILVWLVEYLKRKPQPFCYLDTHAGIGRYDLGGDEAIRTGEWQAGIGRLGGYAPDGVSEPDALIARYLELVGRLNPDGGLFQYPGSPKLVQMLTRPDDRLVLCELHPDDGASLKAEFYQTPGVACHIRDGYEALKAFLPPPERRGLVLIDPPYEATDEFDRLAASIVMAWRRWATGVYAVWYPIKDRAVLDRWRRAILSAGIPKVVAIEFLTPAPPRAADAPHTRPGGLQGSGLLVINPPWGLDEAAQSLGPALSAALGAPEARMTVEWLA